MSKQENCCPRCGGTGGYQYEMKVTHIMDGEWGKEAECSDSTDSTESLVRCVDCGAAFQFKALSKKSLMGPSCR